MVSNILRSASSLSLWNLSKLLSESSSHSFLCSVVFCCVYVPHLLISSPVQGHLDCFQHLSVSKLHLTFVCRFWGFHPFIWFRKLMMRRIVMVFTHISILPIIYPFLMPHCSFLKINFIFVWSTSSSHSLGVSFLSVFLHPEHLDFTFIPDRWFHCV